MLENKVDGDLKDFLKALDEEQIDVIASVYYDDEDSFFKKSLNSKIEYLEKNIIESYKEIIRNASYKQYVILDKLSNNEDVTNMSELFLYSGFCYSYYDKTEVKNRFKKDIFKGSRFYYKGRFFKRRNINKNNGFVL